MTASGWRKLGLAVLITFVAWRAWENFHGHRSVGSGDSSGFTSSSDDGGASFTSSSSSSGDDDDDAGGASGGGDDD